MEVHLPQNQEAQLRDLSAQTGRGTDDLVQEAVARLLAHNDWFKAQVKIGIDQIARGEFIEEEEMDARLRQVLALESATCSWKDTDHPELRQDSTKWIRKLRQKTF